jgi:hypothetical protein
MSVRSLVRGVPVIYTFFVKKWKYSFMGVTSHKLFTIKRHT